MIISDKERQAPTSVSNAEPSHLARYQFALDYIDNKSDVLDVPCGSGYGSNLLSTRARTITGIDIHSGAIQHANEFFRNDKISFCVADMQDLETYFANDKKFDVIVSFEGIEHIREQTKFLNGVSKLLSKDGRLIISTPRKPHGSPYHIVEFSLEEFSGVLSKFFTVEKMFGQIYTDIFDMEERKEDPASYHRFNFIAICKLK